MFLPVLYPGNSKLDSGILLGTHESGVGDGGTQ